ncbi:hypothetical protein EDC30_107133 [Paucimonas lemoignei]|uniref:Uncharacterized protein n=1 Tax=Paucimonas lemoignei TaxID=29443 RepID=A0A4R3HT01_PAULE|nr:hypothetical protein [Paucimonas lemoignei]TCS36316.1 hypothetical protein EDC30_107133 [Paucimonas lemoignei]
MPEAEPEVEPVDDVPLEEVPEVPEVVQAVNANAQAMGTIHFFMRTPWSVSEDKSILANAKAVEVAI